MRMKFNKSRQLLLAAAASLLAAGVVTACGTTATTDFVYVASSKAAGPNNYGEIDVFEINAVSGAMRQIPTSPFPSGGRSPVAEAVSSDNKNLYVVNQDDNNIVQMGIGSDGKLYPQSTVNTPGIYPMAVAVNGLNLFIVDTYQPLPTCSNAAPCSGSVGVFPILSSSGTGSSATPGGGLGTLIANGSLNYWPLTLPGKPNDVIVPTAVNLLASGPYLYVTAFDWTAGGGATAGGGFHPNGAVGVCSQTPSAYSGNNGYVFGFSVGSGGALSPLNGGAPVASGTLTLPCGVASASDTSGAFYLYVTDSTNGNVHGYSVASGALTELNGSPFAAGNQPSAIVADPSYPFVYAANSLDGTVSAYSIGGGGALASIGTYDTGLQPVAMGIDPSTSHYLFTVNFLGSDVSDFVLSTSAGTLVNTQHSPYVASAQPTAVAAIPHGGAPK